MATRRENGAGTAPQQSDNGRWFMQLSYRDPETDDLKRTTIRGTSQGEVIAKKKEFVKKIEAGIRPVNKGTTFQEWVNTWLEVNKKNSITGKSYTVYQTIIEHHIKDTNLGKMLLEKVKRVDIQKYFNEKAEALSPRHLKLIKVLVSDALNVAELDAMIIKSPCKNIKLPTIVNKDIDPLNPTEIKLLLEVAAPGSTMYNMIYCALHTGMRRGEILGLRWQDVDFDKKQIAVSQQAKEDPTKENRLIIGTLKTPAANRMIPMDKGLIEVLRWHQVRQNKTADEFGDAYNDLDLIFCQPQGDIISPSVISNRFRAVMEKTEIPKRTFHQLRHTFASVAISQGLNIKAVSAILGHEKISTTLDIYGHLIPGDMETVIQAVAAYYGV